MLTHIHTHSGTYAPSHINTYIHAKTDTKCFNRYYKDPRNGHSLKLYTQRTNKEIKN